ncbi:MULTISPECIES: TIGR04282 family arsenosugar biosynthesis glycosyltransferase [unclassified Aureispira]|uniref:TIGR04282 family arsenosugar biosynthesis glycosyltransferase n=1 Tax=unclassified Aureispira TaxID=2649989 RepID=UPI00069612D5|nr:MULTISPECIES: TIGR04282 family arsenosugar biosynthesis glycosyltransferase [unclassified Aureispira]WMX16591.1 TIGR04282 family arsenosugar biosynthesis glycosyltransferase [Aureispira sp. CCB-E]
MNKKGLLMIFAKNPILGTAKTRLAASVGDKKALEIYQFLLQHTAHLTAAANGDKRVFYSNHIASDDAFSDKQFSKTLQEKGDLGKKMQAGFEVAFADNYERVLIIGSDCYELTTEIINQAFEALLNHDFVIGPAKDGGYYLLGMRRLEPAIFQNKAWSTEGLYQATINDFNTLNYSFVELPLLSDVDYLEDLPQEVRHKFGV